MIYNANGQIKLTIVNGSSYTGLTAADGSLNAVSNTSTSSVGLMHPCGAYNAVTVTNTSSPYYNPNGSLNVIQNADLTFSSVYPKAHS